MKFVESAADLMTPAEMAELSGLQFISGIAAGKYPAPPICRALNYRMTEASEGRVVFRGTPDFAALNPLGTIHGGWFGTLLDSCMACAVQTMLPKGRGYTTLEYKINILRALRHGDSDVEAIGQVVHVGRKTGVAEGRLVGIEDGRVYATGSTTCIVLDL